MISFKIKKSNGDYYFQNQVFYKKLGIGGKAKNGAVEEILTAVAFILTIFIMTLLWIMAG